MSGIKAIQCYIPNAAVSQEELEKHHNCIGKYTKGLCQQSMSLVDDREDVHSLCLSALDLLFSSTSVLPSDVGRLEVGTETLLDTSKSAKTVLMDYFRAHGNSSIEGVTSFNACYGGTAALFNSVAWVQSEGWDGRHAVVVVADIAKYQRGPARATGGAGAVAMLIGKDAPLVLEPARASYSANSFDFCKPIGSLFPVVDGKLANACYLNALDECWSLLHKKYEDGMGQDDAHCSMSDFKSILFHAPYCKLTRRAHARLLYLESAKHEPKREPKHEPKHEPEHEPEHEPGPGWAKGKWNVNEEGSACEAWCREESGRSFFDKVDPSLLLARQCGNMYAASLYGCLASVLSSQTFGKDDRLLLFSYGSGLVASLFSMRVINPELVRDIGLRLRLKDRLEARDFVNTSVVDGVIDGNENTCVPLGEGAYFKHISDGNVKYHKGSHVV